MLVLYLSSNHGDVSFVHYVAYTLKLYIYLCFNKAVFGVWLFRLKITWLWLKQNMLYHTYEITNVKDCWFAETYNATS